MSDFKSGALASSIDEHTGGSSYSTVPFDTRLIDVQRMAAPCPSKVTVLLTISGSVDATWTATSERSEAMDGA